MQSKKEVRNVLIAVDRRFKDGRYWDRGYWAKDQWEVPVEWDDPNACCWCFAGGIHKETNDNIDLYKETTAYVAAHLVKTERTERLEGEDDDSVIIYWNDADTTHFLDIKDVLRECIEELS